MLVKPSVLDSIVAPLPQRASFTRPSDSASSLARPWEGHCRGCLAMGTRASLDPSFHRMDAGSGSRCRATLLGDGVEAFFLTCPQDEARLGARQGPSNGGSNTPACARNDNPFFGCFCDHALLSIVARLYSGSSKVSPARMCTRLNTIASVRFAPKRVLLAGLLL